MILLTDYVIWDGWWYSHFIRNRSETPYLTRILREIGRPQDIVFFSPFFLTDNIATLAKILGVTAWIAAAVAQYGFFRTALSLPRGSAAVISSCSLAAPFFPFCGELTFNMYVASVALFWWAWYLTGLRVGGGSRGIAVRIAAAILFILSFELNSHIAHLYAVGLFVALCRADLADRASWPTQLLACVRGYWDLLLLPAAYWVWKNTFTPTSGHYESYNKLMLDPWSILQHYLVFLADFPVYLFKVLVGSGQVGCAAMLCLSGAIIVRNRRAEMYARCLAAPMSPRLVWSSALLFIGSIFSYCAVNQPVLCEGWAARNTILINVPFAVMIVSGCGVISRMTPKHRAWCVLCPVALFIIAGLVACNRTTLRWQGFGAKQLAIRAGVREMVQSGNATATDDPINVVHLRDYVTLADTLPWYPPIVWTYMVAAEDAEPTVFVADMRPWLPDEIRIGVDGQRQVKLPAVQITREQLRQFMEQTTQPYALTHIPLSGRTVNVAIVPGENGVDAEVIGWRYLMLRLFRPSTLPNFIAGTAKLVKYE